MSETLLKHACQTCNAWLTRTERRFYGSRCERCERAWSERITAWRKGEIVEPELDRFYGANPS